MERILVIGGNGSGKSVFSTQLAEKLSLPCVHLDRLFWKGNWESVSREEFDALLLHELEKPRWIIDGHYGRTIPLRLQYCDMVFYLDFSRARCLWGAVTRIIKNYGTTRPDMGENCPERFDWEFLKGVWTFNKRNRKKTYARLEAAGVPYVVFKNRREVRRYLESL